jgi:signal transduction histidine kinase/ligand-binding sensor domain-containing protein/CheY-like chemotaxis protein/HPt (histidine-containing phosphotransfer) domain-containing protein
MRLFSKKISSLTATAALLICVVAKQSFAVLPDTRVSFWPAPVGPRLIQKVVEQTFQDKSGVIWMATQEGLSRFDGKNIEGFSPLTGQTGVLLSASVNGIAETSDGKVWVATSGLQHFDEVSRLFVTVDNVPTTMDIFSIAIDNDDRIWMGSAGRIGIYNVRGDYYSELPLEIDGVKIDDNVIDIEVDQAGNVFALIDGSGLFQINIERSELKAERVGNKKSLNVTNLWTLEITPTEIWLGTQSDGIYIFERDSFQLRHVTSGNLATELPSDVVYSIFAEESRVWIGTSKGLAVTDDFGRTFTNFTELSDGVSNDTVRSIYKSSDGIYWIGTNDGLVQGSEQIYQTLNRSNSGLSRDDVNAITQSEDGTLWVGTSDGLNFSAPGEQVFNWINSATHPTLQDDIIMSLVAQEEAIWIGTFEGGLYRYLRSNNTIRGIAYDDRGIDLTKLGITSLITHSSGVVIAGTYGYGILVLSYEGEVIRTIQAPTGSSVSDEVFALLEDLDGSVLVGHTRGLAKLSADLRSISEEPLFRFQTSQQSIANQSVTVWEIAHGLDDSLWLGTLNKGLIRVNRDDNLSVLSAENLTQTYQLPSLYIVGIHRDAEGYLWLSHNRGLTRIREETGETEHFSTSLGMSGTEFNMGASYRNEGGRIYFGSDTGVNTLERLERTQKSDRLKIGIAGARISDRYVDLSGGRPLTLSQEDRVASIEVFAAEYLAPETIEYKYRYSGYDEGWIYKGTERTIDITGLPSGQYSLQVAARSATGRWHYDGLSIPVNVLPPWWQTTTAYISYGAFFFGAIWLALWVYRRNLNAGLLREQELAERVKERTIDLERTRLEAEEANRAKSEFLAVMSHEIRTPLHGIIGMTDLMLNTNVTPQQQRFGNAIMNSGQTLLHLINEILDLSKIEADRVEVEHTKFNLTQLVDEVCYLQGELAQRKDLVLHVVPQPNLASRYAGDPQKIRQIITNLIGNAIKFTEHGSIVVRLFLDEQDRVVITVRDTGIGIQENARDRIFDKFTQVDASTTRKYGGSGLGLTISRNYAELMGGSLEILETAENSGTLVQVVLPLEEVSRYDRDSDLEIGVLTHDDVFAESVACQAILVGLSAHRLSALQLNNLNRFAAVIVDEFFDDDVIDRIELDDSIATRILAHGTRSVNRRVNSQRWESLHTPVVAHNLEEAVRQIGPHDRPSADQARFSGRILVAEDNTVNQLLAQEMLESLGLDVVIKDNGLETFQTFVEDDFDVILMDCQMPVMDGFEAAREIREHERQLEKQRIPIIAATAAAQKGEFKEATAAGMDHFMTKPYSKSDLIEALSAFLSPLQNEITSTTANESRSGTRSEEPDNVPLIRPEVLRNIARINPDKGKDLVQKVLDSFTAQLPQALRDIEACIQSPQTDDLRRRTHSLKSSALNIGAHELGALLNELELQAKAGKALSAEQFIQLESLAVASRDTLLNSWELILDEPAI